MPDNIIHKVLAEHLISGRLSAGEVVSIRIDQVLLQDATGTMAWMEFEQLEKSRVQVPLAVQYGDHNTTAGAVGSFALGIGGMDAAVTMAGFPFELLCPAVVRVALENQLGPWVSAKDIILELLRRQTVKGGINKAFAFDGPGVETLT